MRVTNRGAAISSEAVPTLFDPFRRSSQDNDNASLGLGLFIVSQIVQRHGGRIDVQSRNDETTFTVFLPRKPPAS